MTNTRVKTSLIVENQLPLFVQDEFPLVSEFLKQYYIALENQGGVLDILQNIDQYVKVDNLTNLVESTILQKDVSIFDTSIDVVSTYGFPERYGIIKINNEIITYTSKTSTSFQGCIRGFSGISSLKNNNEISEVVFESTNSSDHVSGDIVTNLSILFLKEFFKKAKTLITPGFENIEFFSGLNEKTFIKQSKDFYSLKGTDESFKILFGALYGEQVNVIKPRDYLIRPSDSQYRITKDLVVQEIKGDLLKLLNKTIYQPSQQGLNFAYGTVTNVQFFNKNNKDHYVLSIDYDYDKDINVTGSVYGNFKIHPKTKLISNATSSQDYLDVDSTVGFPDSGQLIVDLSNGTQVTINYKSKSLTQFFECSGIDQDILESQDIFLNVYASNYEDPENVTSNDLIKFRITGVISDLVYDDNGKYFAKDDEIYIKTLGENLTDIRSRSFLHNISVSYKISSFKGEGNNNNLKYSFRTFDNNIINVGDRILLSYIAKLPSGINDQVDEIIIVNGINIIKKEFSTITRYPVVDAFTAKRLLSKSTFISYPELSEKYSSNVLNSYKDSDNNFYVYSASLPYYQSDLSAKKKEVTFGGLLAESNILFVKNHGFFTGDSVKYSYTNSTNRIVNLSERRYFVEKIDNDRIKIYNTRGDIYTAKNLGKNTSITLFSVGQVPENTNKLTLFSNSEQEINTSKIIRKFSNPQQLKTVQEIQPGFVGMFSNGVEILSHKSKDSVYYGPIEKIDVLNSGKDYDVINPPSLDIIDGVGYGATAVVSVSGTLKRIEIIDQGHDYLETPIISISGGNGSGATAKCNLISYDHIVNFNASQFKGSVSLDDDTISFSTYHRFRNYEKVVYQTNGGETLVGLSTNSQYFINIQDAFTVKLHKTFDEAASGINTVGISSFGSGIHSLRSTTKKKKLGSISIENEGLNYSNRKNIVYSSGINTAKNTINSPNHGYSDGEIISYSYSQTQISGLSSTSYYVKKLDDNEFYLCQIGVGKTAKDFYYKTNQFVNLKSSPTGQHIFNYPEIQVTINGLTGVSTFTPGNQNAVINPIFRGSITSVSLDSKLKTGSDIGGFNYGSIDIINYNHQPTFNLNSGLNAQLTPIISNGRIVEIVVENQGYGYSSSPNLEIIGDGNGAVLTPIIKNGFITSVKVISGGVGYNKGTFINVSSAGSGAKLYAQIKSWNVNEFEKNINYINLKEGGLFVPSLNKNNLQYCHLYLPENLRKILFSQTFFEGEIKYISDLANDDPLNTKKNHSPIVGWSYDGNPIYGPYGYSDPLSETSNVSPLRSGYIRKESSQEDPNRPPFAVGFFIDDFEYKGIGDLDEHNGRYCVTPEFPNGTYAYFCPLDVSTGIPQFPYIIGKTYKNLPIEFNYDSKSTDEFIDLNSENWKRNTNPYNLTEKNSNYNYIEQPNKITEQITKINSTFSGSIDSLEIKTGGFNYRVGDVVSFDNEGTGGFGAAADVDSIVGKDIDSIFYSRETLNNVKFFEDRSFNGIIAISTEPHNLKYNDIVSISGLSTSKTNLYGNFPVSIVSNTLKLTVGVASTAITGIVTYFEVTGNLNYPYIIENDIVGIGTEKVKILSIDKNNSRIKVLRSYDNTVGSSHSISDFIFEFPRKFLLNVLETNSNSVLDREFYFDPSETLGIGSSQGVGIGYTLQFSNPGFGITSIFIPTKTLYLPNHNFTTGDELIYSNNGGNSISISTNGVSSFNLPDQSTVYVAKVSNDLIGISTFKVGLSTTGTFVGVDSSKRNNGTLFLLGTGTGTIHSFKTKYNNTITATVDKIVATITTKTAHDVSYAEIIDVDVISGISTTYKVLYNDVNSRVVFNPRTFSTSNVDASKNTITINNHNYKTGTKVIHTSTSPSGGLLNDEIYYTVVIDKNTIKLASSYYNCTQVPAIEVDINSASGGTIAEVNPNIFAYKNGSVIFDLSDPSLSFIQNSQRYSAFKLEIFTDKNFVNKLNTKNITRVSEPGLTNASLILKIDENIPNILYYNLIPSNPNRLIDVPTIKKSLISDSENVTNNNIITKVSSKYSGTQIVSGITSNTISYYIADIPESSSYSSSSSNLAYYARTGFSSGPIHSVRMTNGGKNYKTLPGISSIVSIDGYGAILIPNSSNIGKIKSVNIIDYGFDYSSDNTIRPSSNLPISLKIDPLNSVKSVNILSPGKNYTTAPDLVLIDGFTNQVVKDAVFNYSIEKNKVTIVQNTKGIYSAPPRIVPINNSNASKIKNIGFNTTTKDVTVTLDVGFLSGFSTASDFPFVVGDKILIENTTVSTASTGYKFRGYNSENYSYEFFTIKSIDPNIGGVNPSIVFNLSDYFSGTNIPGVFNPLKSSGRVVAEKYLPVFDIELSKNEFYIGENVSSDKDSIGKVQSFDNKNDYLKISTKEIFKINDIIKGKSSASKAIITDIIKYDSDYLLNSTSIVRSGSKTSTGFLNDNTQRMHNNDYYQYFSYSLQSKVSYDRWDSVVNSLNHTVGFKKFSDLVIESTPTFISGECDLVSGICTDQNLGKVITTSDIISSANLNCVYDFDLVTENSIDLGNKIVSDQIKFDSKVIQDYIESSGNLVLTIDDVSSQFDSNPRDEVFSVVDEFSSSLSNYRKYFILIEDTFFTDNKQFNIISLLQDGSFSFFNQYGRVETKNDMGSFDFRIFGSRGQLLFYPQNFTSEDYNISYVSFNLNNSSIGIGTTQLGDTVKIEHYKSDLNVGYASTTVVGIATTFRTSKLLVEVKSIDSSYFEVDEINLIHDNSNVYISEYGQLDNDLLNPQSISGIGTFNAYIDSNLIKVDLIPSVGVTTDYTINTISVSIANTSSVGVGTHTLTTTKISSSITPISSSASPIANTVATIKNPSNGAYLLASVEDKTNNRYQMCELVVVNSTIDTYITEFGTVVTDSSIGVFSSSLFGSDLNVNFTPNPNINVEVRCFINSLNQPDANATESEIVFGDSNIESGFNVYIGTLNDVKRSFYVTHKNLPIFHRYFLGNNSQIVDTTRNIIKIPDHFFRTGEKISYLYDGYQTSTQNAIGIGTTTIPGIGSTDKLPRNVYAVKINDYEIKLASTAENALKLVPEVLDLTFVGLGTNHRLISYNENNRVLISIDNMIQSPLVSTSTTTHLLEDVGFTDTLIKISNVDNVFSENLLNINDEIMRVSAVGVGTTNVIRVQRKAVGSELKVHNANSLITKVYGNYNIVDNVINFVDPPYGPNPIGTITNGPDDRDYSGITTHSTFSGRVFCRSSAVNSSNDPYSTNYIFDDISNQFTGIKTDFSLKVGGSNVTGISTSNAILLIKDIFQGPENSDISPVVGNYYLEEKSGITSAYFKGTGISTAYDVNTSGVPIGGVIISVGSTSGFGYQPLVSAGGTAIVSIAGTIQSISIGNSGSGYRSGIQTVRVAVTTSSLETPNLHFVGTASISNGNIVSVAITNPGTGYTSTNPPIVIFDSPLSYSNIPLKYSSVSSGFGTEAVVNVVVGQGSSIVDFEIINSGYNYRIDDILTIPIGGATGIPTDSSKPFNEFRISVDQIYNNKFASWTIGDLQIFDDFSNEFDGFKRSFQLKLDGLPISILAKENSKINLSSNLLVFINDILQVPNQSYVFDGGSIITFTEAPKPAEENWGGDTLKIYFYRGTSNIDTRDVDILETVKIGDDLRIYDNTENLTENSRSIDIINSSNTVITNTYPGPGISNDEFYSRPIIWCKQTEDRVINGRSVGKDREMYEPSIEPTTNIIQNVGIGSTIIFVSSVKTFFDNERENASNKFISKIRIISQEPKVGAYATAIVSAAGSISYLDLISSGIGYTNAPTVSISSPVGVGTTARFSTTISNGSIVGITTLEYGSNYSQSNPPSVLIEHPTPIIETIEEVNYEGDFGVISGISTGTLVGIASTAIIFDLHIKNDSFLRNVNVVGTAITLSQLQTGYYFIVYNSNVGNGIISLNESNSIVGVGTTFLDNIYKVSSVSIATTNVAGIGLTFVAKVAVAVSSYNGLTGLGYSSFYGEYSWGRISFLQGYRTSPKEFTISNTNGIVGLETAPIIKRYNPLRYIGYSTS